MVGKVPPSFRCPNCEKMRRDAYRNHVLMKLSFDTSACGLCAGRNRRAIPMTELFEMNMTPTTVLLRNGRQYTYLMAERVKR